MSSSPPTHPDALVRARVLSGFPALVARLGGDSAALMDAAGLARDAFDALEAAVPMKRVMALLNMAAELLGTPDFALQLARTEDVRMPGTVVLLASHAATVGEACALAARYMCYHSPRLRIHVENDPEWQAHTRMRLELDVPGSLDRRQSTELFMGVIHRFLVMVAQDTGADWQIGFRHASPLPEAHYRAHFGAAVKLGHACDALSFPTRLLAAPVATHSSAGQLEMERRVGSLIHRFPIDLGTRVEALVAQHLSKGEGTLIQVAELLGLHERTLQRRLKEHGIYFQDIVERVRRSRAEEYLAYPAIPLAQVSAMLGYSEQSSFIRSCRRWFDTTPQAYRERCTSAGPSRELKGST